MFDFFILLMVLWNSFFFNFCIYIYNKVCLLEHIRTIRAYWLKRRVVPPVLFRTYKNKLFVIKHGRRIGGGQGRGERGACGCVTHPIFCLSRHESTEYLLSCWQFSGGHEGVDHFQPQTGSYPSRLGASNISMQRRICNLRTLEHESTTPFSHPLASISSDFRPIVGHAFLTS